MSFKATLSIDDLKINVLYAEYTFRQNTNKEFLPVDYPQAGFITIYLEASADSTLYDWALSSTQKKSGRITFYKRDNQSKLKELIFTDAYCVYFREKFNGINAHPLYIEIRITAGAIKMGQSEYLNPWFENKGREEEGSNSSNNKTVGPEPKNSSKKVSAPEEMVSLVVRRVSAAIYALNGLPVS